VKISDYDYNLPEALIAQTPAEPRDSSRLLVLHRDTGVLEHRHFRDLGDYLHPGDLLVANNSKVLPVRLYGKKADSGGAVEVLLLKKRDSVTWEALVRPGRSLNPGVRLLFAGSPARQPSDSDFRHRVRPPHEGAHAYAEVVSRVEDGSGVRLLRFDREIEPLLDELGMMPLPPYIHAPLQDRQRYQTVYAREPGSAAAPTAGLHFTPGLLGALQEQGVGFTSVTLHVGLDTFRPVTEENVEEHPMHSEWYEINEEAAAAINQARARAGRVVAVGTTSVRVLESAALAQAAATASIDSSTAERELQAASGSTRLFIYPGFQYRLTDAIITNFHLPRSTLLLMIAAFVGRERIMAAYEEAVRLGYQFYSFGDAMLLL